MKHKLLSLAVMALSLCALPCHAALEHMTPKPASMTVGEGTVSLAKGFTVGYPAGLDETMVAEIDGFVKAVNAATSLDATAAQGDGLITVAVDATLPDEGYTLNVADGKVAVTAATPTGLFYAFQTVKKLLPVNVCAGVNEPDGLYELPVVAINDAPRYSYRGFMLDVSRHFFDAAQIKKMLDIMAVYKLNKFHWHLTDDQGWRLPVDKWPLLTTVGATNYNVLLTDFEKQTQVAAGTDAVYGPFSYTPEEIRDIVAYAAERHIEIIPEIDMPGHMVAAIHTYPELSTDPENKNNVHADLDHHMWNRGGVSRDVLDVSNPKVMEFVKDVIDVCADFFPGKFIHIGGDECPTLAWEKSAACQAFKAEKGLTTDRQIQSWFVNEVATYAREKHGKKIMGWNELITEAGVDMNQIKEIDPTIFCWIGGEGKANENGLDFVYTPFNGGYYINRSYAGIDKVGAVRDGALSITLTVNPPVLDHCIGVQGTFWTEQVDRPTDLEYLALPRLMGIAEQGWAPQAKDYDEIMERLIADKAYLDAAGYNYGDHQLVMIEYRTPDPEKWYTLSSKCSDERGSKCVELLSASSPIISSQSGKGAAEGKLWGVDKNADSEWQQFRFVPDPENPKQFAIVCRARPDGSVSSTPSGTGLGDRWSYADGLDYGFILDNAYYAEEGKSNFRYAIRPANLDGFWWNFSKGGQGYAINVYTNPNDGAGGQMLFKEVAEDTPVIPSVQVDPDNMPEAGVYYRLHTRFNGDSSQPRYGSVIELLRDDAGKGNNAQEDRLWSNDPADPADDNFDYQWFTFEPDPEGSEYYALVCRAKPDGSVDSTPAVSTGSNTARWDYDNTAKHYGFYLVKEYQGQDEDGFYSALTSKDADQGWYMNTSAAGQGYSIHLYGNPADQNAGLYTFEAAPKESGISTPQVAPGSDAVYDLLGRRLAAPAPGLNIVGGKVVKK